MRRASTSPGGVTYERCLDGVSTLTAQVVALGTFDLPPLESMLEASRVQVAGIDANPHAYTVRHANPRRSRRGLLAFFGRKKN